MILLYYCIVGLMINANYCETPPVIDGKIDGIWTIADSVNEFWQSYPDYNERASESTTVKVLYDYENLYVLFICKTSNRTPIARLSGYTDAVTLYISPFPDRTIAYEFYVNAAGNYDDAIITDDGRNKKDWDGVWYCATKVYPRAYIVEIKVPFKSIRYTRNIKCWGIQFKRYIPTRNEEDFWVNVDPREGLRVSKFGELVGISPAVVGHYVEIYPIGFARRDHRENTRKMTKEMGVNFVWNVTPETRLCMTINPDFAQIEADPYKLNLSKYELYLPEKRPFFLEGHEIFLPARLGMQTQAALQIFYPRRIGKRLTTGEEVPVEFAIKLYGKIAGREVGVLSALCDSIGYEPQAYYNVLRVKQAIYRNWFIGGIFCDKKTKDRHYYAFDLDGAARFKHGQFIYQCAYSNNNGKQGFAINCESEFLISHFKFKGYLRTASKGFNIEEIGYAEVLPEETHFSIGVGPCKVYKRGAISYSFILFGYNVERESYESCWGHKIWISPFVYFKSGIGVASCILYGRQYMKYPIDTAYYKYSLQFSIQFYHSEKFYGACWIMGGYTWNYYRDYLADQILGGALFTYFLTDRIAVEPTANLWVEFTPERKLEQVTLAILPRISIDFTRDISLALISNPVVLYKNKLELSQNRIGALLSIRFKPKSYLYIAINDHRLRTTSGWKLNEQIAIIKLKWLIYF